MLSKNGGNLGFEEKLWAAADRLRNNMDPALYKHVVLGLIFLKYISDAFEERRQELQAMTADPDNLEYYITDPERRDVIVENKDEYMSDNVFWVPKKARWSYLQANAKQPDIGQRVDEAMIAIEKENATLKGVLNKDYGRATLDSQVLGELVDLVSGIGFGAKERREQDVLGRVYEYFLGLFASAEGKDGGQFYTPQSIVKLLVEMLEPYQGRVFDPCCGSGGMFIQSARFIEAHGGQRRQLSIYGQESNPTTWRLAKMNLAIRQIDANLGGKHADSFRNDLHPDLRADFVIANPPFNDSHWHGDRLRDDKRWVFGTPPASNANYAWIQHFYHHLAPNGTAGFVLANGSLSSQQSGEGDIRKAMVEADVVECIVALPTQLFYNTGIPACLWFVTKNKGVRVLSGDGPATDLAGQILFIDAREMGEMVDRTHRVLTDNEISKIADTYHSWRGEEDLEEYEDLPGFCKTTTIEDVSSNGYVLTPGRYVGTAEKEIFSLPFEEVMPQLVDKLEQQATKAEELTARIRDNLRRLGYGW